jgi:hypothetical protein
MLCDPAFKADVENRAALPESTAEPICTPLSKKLTLPVAVPAIEFCTVAVNVTPWLKTEGFRLLARTVEVEAAFTDCVKVAEVLAEKLESPP